MVLPGPPHFSLPALFNSPPLFPSSSFSPLPTLHQYLSSSFSSASYQYFSTTDTPTKMQPLATLPPLKCHRWSCKREGREGGGGRGFIRYMQYFHTWLVFINEPPTYPHHRPIEINLEEHEHRCRLVGAHPPANFPICFRLPSLPSLYIIHSLAIAADGQGRKGGQWMDK